MCDVTEQKQLDALQQIERLLVGQAERPDIDVTVGIDNVQPYKIDYMERRRLYILSPISVLLTVEDIATVFVPANTWTDIGFQEGQRIFYPGGGTTLTQFFVRATDKQHEITSQSGPFVGPAATPFGSNPTQTAAAGADTLYKWGTNGNQQVQHVVIQNNTGANITYAFDQSTAISTNQMYILATGNIVFWDRAVTILHFASAAQQPFGSSAGISVEGFL